MPYVYAIETRKYSAAEKHPADPSAGRLVWVLKPAEPLLTRFYAEDRNEQGADEPAEVDDETDEDHRMWLLRRGEWFLRFGTLSGAADVGRFANATNSLLHASSVRKYTAHDGIERIDAEPVSLWYPAIARMGGLLRIWIALTRGDRRALKEVLAWGPGNDPELGDVWGFRRPAPAVPLWTDSKANGPKDVIAGGRVVLAQQVTEWAEDAVKSGQYVGTLAVQDRFEFVVRGGGLLGTMIGEFTRALVEGRGCLECPGCNEFVRVGPGPDGRGRLRMDAKTCSKACRMRVHRRSDPTRKRRSAKTLRSRSARN